MWNLSCTLFMYKIPLNTGGRLCFKIVLFCLYITYLFNDTCKSYARHCQNIGWLRDNQIEIRHRRKQTWPNLASSSIMGSSPVRWSWTFLCFPLIVRAIFHMFLCYKNTWSLFYFPLSMTGLLLQFVQVMTSVCRKLGQFLWNSMHK